MAIFGKDKHNNLKLRTIEKVKNIDNPSNFYDLVYNIPGSGDSGGPISAKTRISTEYPGTSKSTDEKRHVLLAIFTNSAEITSKNKCKIYGTKVSEGIVSWIKKIESMKLNSGENMTYHFSETPLFKLGVN